MSALSDTSLHEDDTDIVAEYENRDSENDLGNASDADNESGNEGDEAEESKGRRIDPASSKRRIFRNPQPKLDTERLKGPKGIHTIEKYFEGFKFHGKGHEQADLGRIMKRIEHWAYRLFPRLDYDDFLTRLEVLGSKKDLQVFIKKYRTDMVRADDEDAISREVIDEEEKEEDTGPIDEFDMLITEQIEKKKQAALQQKILNNSASENAFNKLLQHHPSQSSQLVKESNPPSQLSDEVKARIERNRQQALERKMARLKQREEEAKKKKLDESANLEASQESVYSNITKEEANNSTANAKENMVNENEN